LAKCKIEGISEYTAQLNRLEADSLPIIRKCIYDGAAIMADAIKGAIDQIPTRSNKVFGTDQNMLTGITARQKDGLRNSFGISPMSDRNNQQSVKLGFDGYNDVVTDKYPSGQPNQLIARAIESGTSWLQPCHFMSKAQNANKAAVEAKMAETCDAEIAKRTGGII
jgi:hypothetical protein